LWSLVPGEKLGYTVKRLALACYGVTTQTAVIQFDMARGIDVLTKFGMPKLTTVGIPPYPAPNAFIYETDVSKLPGDGSPVLARKKSKAIWQLDPDSDQLARDLERMQYRIERATEYFLLSRSEGKAQSPLIPIYQRTSIRRAPGCYARLIFKRLKAKLASRRHAKAGRLHPPSRWGSRELPQSPGERTPPPRPGRAA